MREVFMFGALVVSLVSLGCTSDDSVEMTMQLDGGVRSDAELLADVEVMHEPDHSMNTEQGYAVFTHKMMKRAGETPFPILAYECAQCTFDQWTSIEPPEGWTKGPPQLGLFSAEHSALRSYPEVEDHPDSVDFLDEVPGNEYRIIAITLSGRLIERGAQGVVVESQVQRDTRLVFTTGMRVHELTDAEGRVFVLFAHNVDPSDVQATDFQAEDALGAFTPPTGFSYATRILDEELVLDSNNHDGIVTVLAIRGPTNSTWEIR